MRNIKNYDEFIIEGNRNNIAEKLSSLLDKLNEREGMIRILNTKMEGFLFMDIEDNTSPTFKKFTNNGKWEIEYYGYGDKFSDIIENYNSTFLQNLYTKILSNINIHDIYRKINQS